MTQNTISGEDFSRRFRNALGMFATGITVVQSPADMGRAMAERLGVKA